MKRTKTAKLAAGQQLKVLTLKPKWVRVSLNDKAYFVLAKVLRRNCELTKEVSVKQEAPPASSKADSCVLSKAIDVRSKPRLKRVKKIKFPKDSLLNITKRLKKWTQVVAQNAKPGKWWVKPEVLVQHCHEQQVLSAAPVSAPTPSAEPATQLSDASTQGAAALEAATPEPDAPASGTESLAPSESAPGTESLAPSAPVPPEASTNTASPESGVTTPSEIKSVAPTPGHVGDASAGEAVGIQSAPVLEGGAAVPQDPLPRPEPSPTLALGTEPVPEPTNVSPTMPQEDVLDDLAKPEQAQSPYAGSQALPQEEPAKTPIKAASRTEETSKRKRPRGDFYIDLQLGGGLSDLHASALGGLALSGSAGFGLVVINRLRLGTNFNVLGQYNAWENESLFFANRLAGFFEIGVLPQYDQNWHIHLGFGYAAGIKVRREDERLGGTDILRLKGYVYLGPAWASGITYDLINFNSLDLTTTLKYTGANLKYYRVIHSGTLLIGLSWM
ncbi:MAG: hypothetical protein QGI45_14690 [Myxococcota bacterium]|nr:hypothetical protein [Myxococcota bacterium]